jgi:uncharacterized protein (TIGR02271 family)
MTNPRTTVVGAFERRADAERAVEELQRAGFRDDQIGFATRGGDAAPGSTTIEETGSHAGSGAASGLLTGGVIGGILGALAAGLIPGIGPVIAGGILSGVVGGAAVGAAAGGLLGALAGMGVPEEEAHHYNREFEAGRTIVTVRAGDRYDEARAIMQRFGVLEYGSAATTDRPMAASSPTATRRPTPGQTDTDQERVVELRQEELTAKKQQVQTGEVGLRKEVVTEQRSIDVPVDREEVVVERRAVEPRASDRPIAEGETIDIPVREERVDVQKRPVVYAEVEIGKRVVQDTERVKDTVRREEARVEQGGDVRVRGSGPASNVQAWDDVSPSYRERWQRQYGSSGQRWEDAEPYYRFGYESANDSRYHGRDWSNSEADLRTDYEDWARRNNYRCDESGWDRYRDSLRDMWEQSRSRASTR